MNTDTVIIQVNVNVVKVIKDPDVTHPFQNQVVDMGQLQSHIHVNVYLDILVICVINQ